MLRSFLFASIFFASTPAFAVDRWLPGERVEYALSAQVTPKGFDELEQVLTDLVPTLIPADALDLGDLDIGIGELTNAHGTIDVRSVNIVPAQNVLQITLNASLLLNSRTDPYNLRVTTGFDWCDDPGWLTANATVKINVSMVVVTLAGGAREFDVKVALANNGLSINSLNVNGACDTVLNIVGDALKGVLVNSVLLPQIQPLINSLGPTISDALKAASIDQSLDVLGSTFDIQLMPKQVYITPAGFELQMSAGANAPDPNPCIAEFDPGGSLKTLTNVPGIASAPSGMGIGAYIADDFVNEVLYAAFRSGVLCVNVDKDLVGENLPIALDSTLIPLIGGEAFKSIIPAVAAPLIIRTIPGKVPTVDVDGARDLGINLKDFRLNFITEIESRQSNVIGLSMNANIGIDLPFDGTTGMLAVNLDDVKAENFTFTVYQSLIPGSEAEIATKFSGLLDTILGAALGGLSDSLAFALPNFSGLGLTYIDIGAGGDQRDWLLGRIGLGVVSYGGDTGGGGDGGCGGCGGGCGGSSSSCGGCSSDGGMIPGAPLYVFLPLWLLRRRRAQ